MRLIGEESPGDETAQDENGAEEQKQRAVGELLRNHGYAFVPNDALPIGEEQLRSRK